MAAIAGIAKPGFDRAVDQMLEKMSYRATKGAKVRSVDGFTIGVRWNDGQPQAEKALLEDALAQDAVSDSHYASAQIKDGKLILTRDPLGVSPLYYGYTPDGALCFASEVKALLGTVQHVFELPPGCRMVDGKIELYYELKPGEPVSDHRLNIASELRRRLNRSIEKRASRGVPFGAWLSGGLDSSIMAALAKPYTKELHTFGIGFPGAEDLEYAQIVARHIRATHHEIKPTLKEIIKILPLVIFHLESFDALLVRSSLMNYLVAKAAADYVPAIFSGEGGDELFAGYSYLKDLSLQALPAELLHLTQKLHNTALQRVDRCASAHGTIAYLGFLDQEVVDYAFSIPAEYKIYNGLEKWILRRSVFDVLPDRVVKRKKAKFWEGAGVEENIAQYADSKVTEQDFLQQRKLPGGEMIQSKEELLYYRIFTEHFGVIENLDWMGRTEAQGAITE